LNRIGEKEEGGERFKTSLHYIKYLKIQMNEKNQKGGEGQVCLQATSLRSPSSLVKRERKNKNGGGRKEIEYEKKSRDT